MAVSVCRGFGGSRFKLAVRFRFAVRFAALLQTRNPKPSTKIPKPYMLDCVSLKVSACRV